MNEQHIEQDLIIKLQDLKYTHRSDIRDRAALERNFREKFQDLNRVRLTDNEFARLLEQIITLMSLWPPVPCASATASSATMARPSFTPWSDKGA